MGKSQKVKKRLHQSMALSVECCNACLIACVHSLVDAARSRTAGLTCVLPPKPLDSLASEPVAVPRAVDPHGPGVGVPVKVGHPFAHARAHGLAPVAVASAEFPRRPGAPLEVDGLSIRIPSMAISVLGNVG